MASYNGPVYVYSPMTVQPATVVHIRPATTTTPTDTWTTTPSTSTDSTMTSPVPVSTPVYRTSPVVYRGGWNR